MYVEYIEYKKDFYGKDIPQNLFHRFSKEATKKINYFTSYRIKEVTEDIKEACCEIIELLHEQDVIKNKLLSDERQIASETVDKHSVTLVNKNSSLEKQLLSKKELDKECYRICCKNIIDKRLLYRGSLC